MGDVRWTSWDGGLRDVASGVPVAVRWRNGNEWTGLADDFQWSWSWRSSAPEPFDIVAYAILPVPPPDQADNRIRRGEDSHSSTNKSR
jgi:hypothetical protein